MFTALQVTQSGTGADPFCHSIKKALAGCAAKSKQIHSVILLEFMLHISAQNNFECLFNYIFGQGVNNPFLMTKHCLLLQTDSSVISSGDKLCIV